MATISFHQICITVLSLGLACGIIACASSSWQMSWNARGFRASSICPTTWPAYSSAHCVRRQVLIRGYSVWLLTASTVFAIEALFFYIIQWRCA
uniref:Secreted protein n=1 Tax=Macrostomum lignano TaxID=282301 RepID=A0A1I8FR41_9PLAT